MSSPAESFHGQAASRPAYGALDRVLRRRMLERLAVLRGGELRIIDAYGETRLGSPDPEEPLHATLRIHDAGFYRAAAANGSVGAGEAYMDGLWSCDDLVALVRLLVRNRDLLDGMEGGLAKLGGWAMRMLHGFRRNTRDGSRKNIAAHYDVGNAFFELFLDDNMMYSSAIFTSPDDDLDTASLRKLDRICEKLQLTADDHLLEIGHGWGAKARHAPPTCGARSAGRPRNRARAALTRAAAIARLGLAACARSCNWFSAGSLKASHH